jgi:hypothetical protein
VVVAMGDGHVAAMTSGVDVLAGATNKVDELKLSNGGGSIKGRVTYGPNPLPVVITLRVANSPVELMTSADTEGKYVFDHLPDGDYFIDFSDPTGEPKPVTIQDGSNVAIDFSYYTPE